MNRRNFIETTSAALLGAGARALAEAPMPMTTLGKSGLRVSRYSVGGYHMFVKGEGERIIRRAMELGVNFFDSAWLYNDGKSDETYGKAIDPKIRKDVLLMSKAQLRSRKEAMGQLEDTLRRMKTDYLDLWQCHQVTTQQEVDQILAPGGALEAFVAARKQGKVRHIGFTGHRDPAVHQRLLDATDVWETVQHPVNLIDPHYHSFIQNVLPRVRAKGLGMIAMKSNGMGTIRANRIATIEECLRFAWSQDVDVLVSGAETVAQLEQNIAVIKNFKPMSPAEQSAILARTAKGPTGSKIEKYKGPPEGAACGGCPMHNDGEPA
jgi:uncharacterized protein